ncbi:hypothetical protein [Lewinella cohaerens]|uniref:hypothetical protein n=1 Tax=Lewinella cohaerens TaxID=70995 RepID=UPI000363A1E6|nr:hypothetical protein [Lewinella cohaerens]
MAFNSDQVWAKFYEKLVEVAAPNFTPGSTDQAVSIAGTTLYADVANADAEITAESVFGIGNMLPAADPAYAPSGDLVTSYSLFLQNIDLGGDTNPNLQSQINIASGNVSDNQTNYNSVQIAAYTQWKAFKEMSGSSVAFPQWANANYPTLAAAKSSLEGAVADYNQLMVQAHGAGFQTLNAAQLAVGFNNGARDIMMKNVYNMAVKVGAIQPAGATKVLPGQTPPAPVDSLTDTFRPAYNLGGGFAQVYSSWQTASTQKQYNTKISLSGNFASSNYHNYGWAASAKASYRSWFSVKASAQASYEATKFDWEASSFDCEISFNGVGSFPINADSNWFKAGMIQNYNDKLLPTAPKFFGDGGSLNLIPSSAILGFGPKITIKVSNANYNSLKTAFQQSASLSIGVGPFSFGGNESSFDKTSSFTYNDDSHTIEIVPPPTTVPLLLGIISNKY